MQNYNDKKSSYVDINECTSRGACSISPTIVSLEVLCVKFLQNLAYYILKLEDLGAENEQIKLEIIRVLASLVSVNEFSEVQLHSIIVREYFMLEEAVKTYTNLCRKNNIIPKLLKKITGFSASTTVSQSISVGEKLFLSKYKNKSSDIKNLTEILNIVIKSLSINLVKINDFNESDNEVYHLVLETLDMYNSKNIKSEEISEKISQLAYADKNLQLKISNLLIQHFGKISEVKVSRSSRRGKAILVSGNSFFDLKNVLEAAKDKDIDIYTHSNLLITHALDRFKKYPNLKGHYGDTTENCILDFATFPGAILLTKNSRNNTEYLYRGRLFSNDYIIPNGVIQIKNDDFSGLIEASLLAKGFSSGKIKEDLYLGFEENELIAKLNQIANSLANKTIKKLYIVGTDAHSEFQREYFKEFFENLKDDEFVLSFSYFGKKDNIYTVNIGNYMPLATKILKLLFDNYSISENNIYFFFTNCDVMTISSIVMIKNLNAKNIYMTSCSPTLVNPSVFETFRKKYGINITNEPIKDLKIMREG
ncbi:hypothetical protein IJ541_09985 [bacterium]|nr:hypothetical protein [bacterium]